MLATACAEQGHDVTLIEGAPELGGLASAWQIAVPGSTTPDETDHLGPALPRDPAVRPAHAGDGAASPASTDELRLGGDEDRLLRHRRRAALGVEHGGVPAPARPQPARQAAPRRHDRLRLARSATGKRMERIPVDAWLRALVGRAHLRALLDAAAAGQARRRLPGGVGGVHLGHDPAALRGAPQRPEEGDVRLRARRLRARARAVRRRRCAAEGVEARCSARRCERIAARRRRARRRRRRRQPSASTRSWSPATRPPRRRPVPRPDGRGGGPAARRRATGHRVRLAACCAGRWRPTTSPTSPTRHAVHRGRGDDGVRRPRASSAATPRVPARSTWRPTTRCSTPPTTRSSAGFLPVPAADVPDARATTTCWRSGSRGCGGSSPSRRSATRAGCRR